ncbi:MAG TPA: hypothetical protein VMY41_03090 [Thermohalobaculum sp.]|nr:hypothetical protein [Thermohalobaculum sp.]
MTGIGLTQKATPPKSLFRPRQVDQAKDEVRNIEGMLSQPQHVLQHVDVPAAMKQRATLKKQLDDLTPRPLAVEERDVTAARCSELRADIAEGMPTQAEMRRNPAGAVDKHRSWERRNKPKIAEWKNARLRMHASGMLDDLPSDASDVANIETFRPNGGFGEMNMHNTQITPTDYHLPPNLASQNHADEEDRQKWRDGTADLLAEFAAKGDTRSRNALVNLIGDGEAKDKIRLASSNIGVAAERPAVKKS